MVINWYGQGCFKIQSGDTVLMVDEVGSESGLTAPRFKFDLAIRTKTTFPLEYDNQQTDKIVFGPGEYEIKGIEVEGWKIANSGDEKNPEINTVYRVKMEDMELGFLGAINKSPEASIIEELGGCDILFLPIGGSPYVSEEAAAKLVKQLSPKIAIGTHFKVSGLKEKVSGFEDFLKEVGQETNSQEKFTIKRKELPQSLKVVILKP